jgi:hypothetical protein
VGAVNSKAMISMLIARRVIKNTLLRAGFDIHRVPRKERRWSYSVDAYYPVHPSPRSTNDRLKSVLEKGRSRYELTLDIIERNRAPLHAISYEQTTNKQSPYWNNEWFGGLDAASLVVFLLSRSPKRYFEIGSGHSTLFARHAINYGRLRTTITSLDPSPRREVDAVCDLTLRMPLEDCGLDFVNELEAGDILFFDGSHRVFTNTDVTVFFLEVIPRLKPGVLVHIHDIFLPDDYPADWGSRLYSEQYLLAAMLLCKMPPFKVILPNYFICTDSALRSKVEKSFRAPAGGIDIPFHNKNQPNIPGVSFWLETGFTEE